MFLNAHHFFIQTELQDKVIYQILARKPDIILDKAREKVMKLTKGNYPAPLEIIKVGYCEMRVYK